MGPPNMRKSVRHWVTDDGDNDGVNDDDTLDEN